MVTIVALAVPGKANNVGSFLGLCASDSSFTPAEHFPLLRDQLDMSSRFKRSQISLAFVAALASPTLLADALEREGRGTRFRRWRIEAAPGDAVRLTGELAVAWR